MTVHIKNRKRGQSMRRMVRRTTIILAASATVLLASTGTTYAATTPGATPTQVDAGGPALAPPQTSDDRVTTHTATHVLDEKYRGAKGEIEFARAAEADDFSIQETPPLGGCDWSDVHGTIQWSYINGVLATVEEDYFSSILCTATAPGQTMQFLSDSARLFKDFQQVDVGTPGSCTFPTQNPCRIASSNGFFACGGPACAGTYHIQHFAEMTLPEGWVWSSWPDDLCVALDGDRTLICSNGTNGVTVPPTG